MEGESSEADKIRKQIQYLTSLIETANQGSTSSKNHFTGEGKPDRSQTYRPYGRRQYYDEQGKAKHKSTNSITQHTSFEKSYPSHENKTVTDKSKYSWKKSSSDSCLTHEDASASLHRRIQHEQKAAKYKEVLELDKTNANKPSKIVPSAQPVQVASKSSTKCGTSTFGSGISTVNTVVNSAQAQKKVALPEERKATSVHSPIQAPTMCVHSKPVCVTNVTHSDNASVVTPAVHVGKKIKNDPNIKSNNTDKPKTSSHDAPSGGEVVSKKSLPLSPSLPHKPKTVDSKNTSSNCTTAKAIQSSCSKDDESKNLNPVKTVQSSCSRNENTNSVPGKSSKSGSSRDESNKLSLTKTSLAKAIKSSCSKDDESKNLSPVKTVKSSCFRDENTNSVPGKTSKSGSSKDESNKFSLTKTSLLEELNRTHSKIIGLRKALSDGSIIDYMSPTRTPLRAAIKQSVSKEKGDLLTLSPYKMKRVDSNPSSMTVEKAGDASTVQNLKGQFSKGSFSDAKKDIAQTSVPLRTTVAKVSSDVLKSKYSYRKTSTSTEMSSTPVNTSSTSKPDSSASLIGNSRSLPKSEYCTNKTPSKLVHKSKYSLKRVRTQSVGREGRSPASSRMSYESKSPKFISLSKFSLKRVRRSSSDTDKKSHSIKQSLAVDRRLKTPAKVPLSSHSQQAAKIIMSKYKMRKVTDDSKSLNMMGSTFKRTGTGYRSSFGTSYSKHSMSWPYSGKRYSGSNYWRGGRSNDYQGGMFARPSKYYPYAMTRHMAVGGFRRGQVQFGFSGRLIRRGQFGFHGYRGALQRVDWNRMPSPRSKFVRRKVRKVEQLKKDMPFNPRMKLDRRTDDQKPCTYTSLKSNMYNSYNKKYRSGFQPNRGQHDKQQYKAHRMNKSGEITAGQVSRVNLGGVTYMQTRPGTLQRLGSVVARMAAARAVSKSVAHAVMNLQKASKKSSTDQRQYCLFFNRFGKCNRGNSCPFIHDRNRIAVCTRFLRGTCKVKDCPFSHTVSKEKMPVCSFFLRGMCNKDVCPYLHVNVNRNAEICCEFVNGYCPLGEKCKKKHTLLCPAFAKTGYCPEGKKCKLQHRRKGKKKSEAELDGTRIPLTSLTDSADTSSRSLDVVHGTYHATTVTSGATTVTSGATTVTSGTTTVTSGATTVTSGATTVTSGTTTGISVVTFDTSGMTHDESGAAPKTSGANLDTSGANIDTSGANLDTSVLTSGTSGVILSKSDVTPGAIGVTHSHSDVRDVTVTSSVNEDDSHLPFKERRLPAYISLNMKQEQTRNGGQLPQNITSSKHNQDSTMKIRPKF